MVTNKALAQLAVWAQAASSGRGHEAKLHLTEFKHLGAAFMASPEFHDRCQHLFGRTFDFDDLDRLCQVLDAVANIEVCQVEKYGVAETSACLSGVPIN
jgi:hypothetical protein